MCALAELAHRAQAGRRREKVRVARALGVLPLLSDAMQRGQISYSKVRALTRVATPANERRLLDFALWPRRPTSNGWRGRGAGSTGPPRRPMTNGGRRGGTSTPGSTTTGWSSSAAGCPRRWARWCGGRSRRRATACARRWPWPTPPRPARSNARRMRWDWWPRAPWRPTSTGGRRATAIRSCCTSRRTRSRPTRAPATHVSAETSHDAKANSEGFRGDASRRGGARNARFRGNVIPRGRVHRTWRGGHGPSPRRGDLCPSDGRPRRPGRWRRAARLRGNVPPRGLRCRGRSCGIQRTARSSTSGARRAPSRRRCGGRCRRATVSAASRAATPGAAMRITFTTGPTAARRGSTTSCCSAGGTTVRSTRRASRSGSMPSSAGGRPAVPPPPRWSGPPLAPTDARLAASAIVIDADTATPDWHGERLDVFAIDVMWIPRTAPGAEASGAPT